ncbi:hypothetical protein IEQ34_013989 [Dendrobium chrysotoxum]|uniref:Bifunctional inhibitor/plant lipid transfer protein/seed storage helical domain-containing protein n=1 Tax=Dendrobium chrysotoxum TaxID=161865 RepID=A0AAV7GJH6_DENCH|nr:hypothetical protein IEQ34_013989 [Dendrobium chrysotoxum]
MGVLAAKKRAVTVALLAAAILAMMAANAEAQVTQLTCASKLITCRNYLNSTNPPEECCKPLKDAVTNDLTCLCDIFKSPEILKGFGIDIKQALKLPFNCGITNSSDSLCKSTAAESPSGNPGPPGKVFHSMFTANLRYSGHTWKWQQWCKRVNAGRFVGYVGSVFNMVVHFGIGGS